MVAISILPSLLKSALTESKVAEASPLLIVANGTDTNPGKLTPPGPVAAEPAVNDLGFARAAVAGLVILGRCGAMTRSNGLTTLLLPGMGFCMVAGFACVPA